MKYLKLLEKGGEWLGEMREYLLHTYNGDSLIWGSHDVVHINTTVKQMEVLAAKIAEKAQEEIPAALTHPQVDIDFYNWMDSLSEEDKHYLKKFDKDVAFELLHFGWVKSRAFAKQSLTKD